VIPLDGEVCAFGCRLFPMHLKCRRLVKAHFPDFLAEIATKEVFLEDFATGLPPKCHYNAH